MIAHRFCHSLLPCSKLISDCRRVAAPKQAVPELEQSERDDTMFRYPLSNNFISSHFPNAGEGLGARGSETQLGCRKLGISKVNLAENALADFSSPLPNAGEGSR